MRLFFCLVICSIFLSCYAQDDNRVLSLAELSKEEILPYDSLTSLFDEQPSVDSIKIKKKAAYNSLFEYITYYYNHNKQLMGKLPDKLVHYHFWFECIFDKYGNLLSVKGRYGEGKDPFEDVVIDYLKKMPRYEEWEELGKCFSYKAVAIRWWFVI